MVRIATTALALALAATSLVACRAHYRATAGGEAPPPEAAPAPAPVPATPPPPPPPCDVLGSWQAQPPLPLGPQQIDIAPGDRPGVFMVRARNGANLGVATIQNSTGGAVDTKVTDPLFRCTVGPDCNTLSCALTGGAPPATFKRIPQ